MIIYKQYILFKRFLLWPFKLGIFSFVFSIIGIDASWFLGWFNIFPLNIPQWVYFQYLILYNNWLNWWKNVGQIKNLSNVSVNKIPSVNKSLRNFDLDENTLTENSDNKIFNRKNLYILLGVLTLIGVGIWYYYYYYNGTGGAQAGGTQTGGNILPPNPPAGNIITINLDELVGDLTDAQRLDIIDRLNELRMAGRLTREQYDHFRELVLPSLPVYHGPIPPSATDVLTSASIETPIVAPTDNVAEGST